MSLYEWIRQYFETEKPATKDDVERLRQAIAEQRRVVDALAAEARLKL
jgi:hypothetical protein